MLVPPNLRYGFAHTRRHRRWVGDVLDFPSSYLVLSQTQHDGTTVLVKSAIVTILWLTFVQVGSRIPHRVLWLHSHAKRHCLFHLESCGMLSNTHNLGLLALRVCIDSVGGERFDRCLPLDRMLYRSNRLRTEVIVFVSGLCSLISMKIIA